MKIDATLSPAELPSLRQRDLRDTLCVVFDVLRATSVMVTALHNGAKAIVPVAEIEEALAVRQKQPDVLLGGERNSVRIRAAQTGGIDFDFGNSPREYTPEKVRGKTIVSTTTNGTRALLACAKAKSVLVGSFLNLSATACAVEQQRPLNLLLVCAGTREHVSLEDVLAAGALCEILARGDDPALRDSEPQHSGSRGRSPHQQEVFEFSDSAQIAHRAYAQAKADLAAAVRSSENARRLLAIPELRDDVEFCLRRDAVDLVATLNPDGAILRVA